MPPMAGSVAALAGQGGLIHFERIIDQTTETMPQAPKQSTAAAMTTNRIASLRELLHPIAGKCYSINIKGILNHRGYQ